MQNDTILTRKRRLWIDFGVGAVLVALGLGGGFFYADSQPKQWKAEAVLSLPQVADLGNYFSLYTTYQLVQNDGKSDPNIESIVAEAAYNQLKQALVAEDLRKQFLMDNERVKQIADVHYQPLNETVNRINEQLHFNDTNNTLSLTLVNPEQAVEVLEQFLSFQQAQVRSRLNNELIAKWKFLFQNVKQSADANLGESWQGKLTLMRSVEPLDNRLVPYHLIQKPIAAGTPQPPERLKVALLGGGLTGLLLGLLFVLFRRL